MTYRTMTKGQAALARDILDPRIREVAAVGPYGSGKTATALPYTMAYLASCFSGRQAALITAGRDAMVAMVEEELAPWAEHYGIICKPRRNGIQVGNNFLWQVVGADRRSYRRLKGRNLCVVYCNETTEIPANLFDQALDRLRIGNTKFVGDTNPDSPAHWYKRHIDRHRVKEHILPLWSNPTQTADYVKRQLARHTGANRDRYVLGKWALGPLAAFPYLADSFGTPDANMPFTHCGISVDVGSAVSTHALLYHHDLLGNVWTTHEWVHDPAEDGVMRPRDQAAHIAAWAQQHAKAPIKDGIVDLADIAFEDILDFAFTQLGVNVAWKDYAKIRIDTGLKVTNRRLHDGRLRICQSGCPVLIDQAAALEVHNVRLERGEEDPDPYGEDHGPDSLRYYTVHVLEGL